MLVDVSIWPIATLPQEFESAVPESGQTRTDVNDRLQTSHFSQGLKGRQPQREAGGRLRLRELTGFSYAAISELTLFAALAMSAATASGFEI
jgi:hypothetical protein